jgi:hypothetical protein
LKTEEEEKGREMEINCKGEGVVKDSAFWKGNRNITGFEGYRAVLACKSKVVPVLSQPSLAP